MLLNGLIKKMSSSAIERHLDGSNSSFDNNFLVFGWQVFRRKAFMKD